MLNRNFQAHSPATPPPRTAPPTARRHGIGLARRRSRCWPRCRLLGQRQRARRAKRGQLAHGTPQLSGAASGPTAGVPPPPLRRRCRVRCGATTRRHGRGRAPPLGSRPGDQQLIYDRRATVRARQLRHRAVAGHVDRDGGRRDVGREHDADSAPPATAASASVTSSPGRRPPGHARPANRHRARPQLSLSQQAQDDTQQVADMGSAASDQRPSPSCARCSSTPGTSAACSASRDQMNSGVSTSRRCWRSSRRSTTAAFAT